MAARVGNDAYRVPAGRRHAADSGPASGAAISPHLTLYCKFEGMNPTGSFKDRGMTMAVTKAL